MKISIRDFALGVFAGCLIGWAIAKVFEPVPFIARNDHDVQRQMNELIRRESQK